MSSMRKLSFLDEFRFPIEKNIKLIHAFAFEHKINDTMKNLDLDRKTIMNFNRRLREMICFDMDLENLKLGGPGVAIEIDESKFAKVKHGVGKDLKRDLVWVFGMKERFSDKVYFQIVQNRTKEVLLDIIDKHVEDESLIYSDEWRSYRNIQEMKDKNLKHKTVNHSKFFVNPKDRNTHTQNIESLWRAAKQKFKAMNGVDRMYLDSYLTEFIWRYSLTDNRMDAFLKILDIIPKHW